MTQWVRFKIGSRVGFGTLQADDTITVHEGDMFHGAKPTGETEDADAVTLLAPCVPSKMVALWNNFHELAAKLNVPEPPEPLYLLKANNAFAAHGDVIRKPKAYDGKVVFEGELGVVIGKRVSGCTRDEAPDHIFGYTCVNDVTAGELIQKDPTFAQWVRAKGFDTFGPFGPAIVTGIDPYALTVKTILNGQERQSYPVADMIFGPYELVSLISRDMTLEPGDIITCGTSVGVGSMKPGSTVEVLIDGVGHLVNVYQ
jgi:2-keto-4-pentenoate hydratase/2-oxohepta-3-ene-1,7-dioic acid hydratase in catechol pathway